MRVRHLRATAQCSTSAANRRLFEEYPEGRATLRQIDVVAVPQEDSLWKAKALGYLNANEPVVYGEQPEFH